ncbi:MAG: c-type cytochrome [Gemmataceae bacterium]|nr:c-type cytochrome [Gemmataceae bacterium]
MGESPGLVRLLRTAVGLLLAGMLGCRSNLEELDYAFPSRVDALVLRVPDQVPEQATQPGHWEAELNLLQRRGGQLVRPLDLPLEQRLAVDAALKELFGTPARPRLVTDSPAKELLGLTEERLSQGGQLYRRHRCLQCHNVTGDGRGPAGQWVTPYPRDFRQGVFKFTTSGSVKPRRQDLLRTLQLGLKGTAMPSFALLAEAERDLLASYVTNLAVRGQVEFVALAALAGQPCGQGVEPLEASAVAEWMARRLTAVLTAWEQAEQAVAVPPSPDDGPPGSPAHQAAVQRGWVLFTAKRDNSCISCHGDYGRQPQLRYEVWGTTARPANLTDSPLKSQPGAEQLYARIRWGIPAVGMPAHPDYSDRQVWDLVRFVQSLPFPRELPPEVRMAVYPDSGGP